MLAAVLFPVLMVLLDHQFAPPAPPGYSMQVFDSKERLLTAYLADDDTWRLRTRLEHVTPELIEAILEKEDRWFLYHRGVNPVAVVRALYANIRGGRRVSGASTITMQVARMLEPAERTYSSKLREMIRALQLELRYSKRDIMELYLSHLPMGGNIEGVASAAYIYFDRPPDKLSLAQCIALAVLPTDPNRLRLDRSSSVLNEKKNLWVRRFRDRGVFDDALLDAAHDEQLTASRFPAPGEAPHFSLAVRKRSQSDIVNSTLDGGIQDIAEQLLRNHVRRVIPEGVTNGAVLVIRNDNMDVAAYCGSADFHDAANHGQVDGVRSVRSPGSTLKPLLYARAFDEGALTPSMHLLDIPTDFGGYIPENFDLTYRGEVTVREALLQSLNIPAVRLLAKHGVPDMVSFLTALGFRTIEERRERLGLSLILGGCGVTLEELVRAASIFAREGRLSYLRMKSDEPLEEGKSVLTPAAAYLVSDILSNNKRPDMPTELLTASRLPRIAWKTGTSYGKRDAWAIGWNSRYTIGVWMGNFSGRGAPTLSGAVMAVPLLVDLFNAIDYNSGRAWLRRPGNVVRREVCAKTGLLPSPQCSIFEWDYAIDNVSTRERCTLQQEFMVDAGRTMHYCQECAPAEGYERVWLPVYDPELAVWFSENNVDVPSPPPHNPLCTVRMSSGKPVVISPSPEYEYYIERGGAQQICLQAAPVAGVRTLFWYVDGEMSGQSTPGGKLFFTPRKTSHRITCMDDAGRRSTFSIRITFY